MCGVYEIGEFDSVAAECLDIEGEDVQAYCVKRFEGRKLWRRDCRSFPKKHRQAADMEETGEDDSGAARQEHSCGGTQRPGEQKKAKDEKMRGANICVMRSGAKPFR